VSRTFLRITEVTQSDTYQSETLLRTQVHSLSEGQSQINELVTGRWWSESVKLRVSVANSLVFSFRTTVRAILENNSINEHHRQFRAQSRQQPKQARRRTLVPYATGSAGFAITVRGSSRRIMIMRFRPANIRLINRRSTCPGCCSLCPRERAKATTKTPTDFAELTRSLHIRASHSSSPEQEGLECYG